MKTFIVCVLALIAIAAARPSDEKYTDKYDNVNIEEVLENARLLSGYVKCALETGKCSNEARVLKSHIKDALETDCSKCNDTQKTKVEQVMRHLINHEPEYWTQLTAKYDPDHKYSKKHEDKLRAIKTAA